MKKQKVKRKKNTFLISSNDYEDDDCPICTLMRKVEKEGREPTEEELRKAFIKADGKIKTTENKPTLLC